jgi:hypothetical protein
MSPFRPTRGRPLSTGGKETAASLAGKVGGQPKGREEATLAAEAKDELNHRPTLRNALI